MHWIVSYTELIITGWFLTLLETSIQIVFHIISAINQIWESLRKNFAYESNNINGSQNY
jgi:hypothetical protein